jgi:hypothetical protein
MSFLAVIPPPAQWAKNLGDDERPTIVEVRAELIGKEHPRRYRDHAGQCRHTATK